MAAVVGLRARTGKAEAIVLARGPRLVARAHLVLAGDDDQGFCYHAAAERAPAEGERYVARARQDAIARAVRGLRPLVREHAIARAAVVRGKPRALPPFERIRLVHALWHAAEGELFRDALEAACAELGVPALPVPQAELAAPPKTITALGREAGAPWRVEHKEAAMAALVVLS